MRKRGIAFCENFVCYLVSFCQTLWLKAALSVSKTRDVNRNHAGESVKGVVQHCKKIKWSFLGNKICLIKGNIVNSNKNGKVYCAYK